MRTPTPVPSPRQTIEAHFDTAAPTYETYRLAAWYQALCERVVPQIDDPGDGIVLDIGCGTGWLLRRITEPYPAARGIGIDLSGNMIETARRNAAGMNAANLEFIQADWEDPGEALLGDLTARRIDTVICTSAFHYFGDPAAATERIFRLLPPGGRFLLLERAKDRSWLTVAWDLLHRFLIRDEARFYRSDELIDLLREAGFRSIKIEFKIKRLMWNNKLHTSVALISAIKPQDRTDIHSRDTDQPTG